MDSFPGPGRVWWDKQLEAHKPPLHIENKRFGPHNSDWAKVVGARIRTARKVRGQTLVQFAAQVQRPDRYVYSTSYISRIERGYGGAAIFTYEAIADMLDVSPGRLLGSHDVESEVTEAELTLVRYLRETRVEPHEAIARLAAAEASAAAQKPEPDERDVPLGERWPWKSDAAATE